MEGIEGKCVWEVWIKAIGSCILIRLGELQMDAQNEEALKFFNVEEDEENGDGADGKKRYVEKNGGFIS